MFDPNGLLELGQELASTDVSSATNDELFEAAVAMKRAESWLTAGMGHVLAELDAREACDVEFGLKTVSWLAREADCAPAGIGRDLRTARKLRARLDEVEAALVAGILSIDHVRVIAEVCNDRIIDGLVPLQGVMIAMADGLGFDAWKREVRHLAELIDQDGPHDPNDDVAKNQLRLSEGLDGLGFLQGRFTAEQWLPLKQAILDKANELFRRYRAVRKLDPDVAVPSRGTLLALALAELVNQALGIDLDSTAGPRTDLSLVLRPEDLQPDKSSNEPSEGDSAVDGDDDEFVPSDLEPDFEPDDHGPARADDEHGDAGDGVASDDDVARDDQDDDLDATGTDEAAPAPGGRRRGIVTDRRGIPILASVLAYFLCDPDVYPIIVDSLGVPVDMGRRIRHANRAQRRAIAVHDGGYAFPGCDRPIDWCDLHHADEWDHDGPTDIVNLIGLCRVHHGVAHRHGWKVNATADGWFWFQTRNGRTWWAQRHHKRRTDPPPPPIIRHRDARAA